MIDVDLLQKVREGFGKEAYAPPAPDPAAAGMPLTDPAMAAAGGALPAGMSPVDPMAAGGALPAGMSPVDPMAAGGMPPVDPMAMVGAMPGAMSGVDPMTGLPPMDPTAMGGAPMDPSMSMPPTPSPEMVQVSMDDLRAILREATGEKGEEVPAGEDANIEERLSMLEAGMTELLRVLGVGEEMPAPEEIPPGAEGEIPPMPAGAVPAGMPVQEPVQELPQDFSLLEAPVEQPGMPEQKAAEEISQDQFVSRLRAALGHV